MPRPRAPHLQREVTRHGRAVWYVRVGKGPRIRLTAEYGSPEFAAAYRAALEGKPPTRSSQARAGSLHWLIEQYRESSAWRGYSLATRRQRENIFKQVIASAGHEPFTRISEATIVTGRERRRDTPFQARHFLDAMRGLFAWASEAQHVRIDPTRNVKYPKLKSGEGFPVWREFRRRRLRVALAARHAATRLARPSALHRPEARRCGSAWQAARARRHRHAAPKRPGLPSPSPCCRRSSRRCARDRSASLPTSAARMASR